MSLLGEKIKSYREALGWKQKDLALKANVSPATISGVENGRFVPTPEILYRLSKELGVAFHEVVEVISDIKLDTLIEILQIYLIEGQHSICLPLLYKVKHNHPHIQDYQQDKLQFIEASSFLEWEQTRMQGIQTLYSLTSKWESLQKIDPLFYMKLHNSLGAGWYLNMDYISSLHHYMKALEALQIDPSLVHDSQVPRVYHNIGTNLRWIGREREAIVYLQKALPLLKKHHNYVGVGGCYFAMGMCYQDLGDFSQAADLFLKAIPWAKKIHLPWLEVRCRSYAFTQHTNLQIAIELLEQELFQTQSLVRIPPDERAAIHTITAKVYLQCHNFSGAQLHLKEAKLLLMDLSPAENHAFFLLISANYYFALGDYDTASDYAFEAVDLYSSLRIFHSELKEALRISKEAVLKLRHPQKKGLVI